MRLFILLFALMLPSVATAQMRDGVFKDYDSFSQFVDDKIMTRDFKALIVTLGGRDEYTPEQLEGVNTQLLSAFPQDFTNTAVFKKIDLGGGVQQEGRIYWTGESYAFFYSVLHQRDDGLVVITFYLNSNIGSVLAKF